jgi:hypothetical protein
MNWLTSTLVVRNQAGVINIKKLLLLLLLFFHQKFFNINAPSNF